jgi:FkbH-like protein
VRRELLDSPWLQVNAITQEARSRHEMVKAQLARDAAAKEAPDRAAFLRSLGIRLGIQRVQDGSRLLRAVELIQRTHQFNTTQQRWSADDLRRLTRAEGSFLFTLEVADRFTDYGVVGACVIVGRSIELVVMSCRVLALEPAVPFLGAVLRSGLLAPEGLRGRIILSERNEPCRALFRAAGFRHEGGETYVLDAERDLPAIDGEVYQVQWKDRAPES